MTTNANATIELTFNHVSTLLVGGLLNPPQAALWRVAKQIADAVAAPAAMVVNALYPEFAKLRASGDHHTIGKIAARVIVIMGGLATMILVICTFAGGPVLGLFMGKAFVVAGPVLTWLVGASVIGVWAAPLEPILVSIGRPGVIFRSRSVAAAIYLLMLWPVIRMFGLSGAGAGMVIAQLATGTGMLVGVMHWYRDPRTGLAPPAPPKPKAVG